jgi:hypothetical protein
MFFSIRKGLAKALGKNGKTVSGDLVLVFHIYSASRMAIGNHGSNLQAAW